MKFALVNNQRIKAQPGLKGQCSGCEQDVVAKCGTQKIWHWAHRATKACDSWSEPETEWHRAWKNKFPHEWQEVIQHDTQTGEKHIADIRTDHDLVIEFQHSRLDSQEQVAREQFYKNMIWIVDGTRLKRDIPRFTKGSNLLRRTAAQGYFLLACPEECFPKNWLESSVPVIFDFMGTTNTDERDIIRNTLWCLLPGRAEGSAVVVAMSREQLVSVAPTRPTLIDVDGTMKTFKELIQIQRRASLASQRRQENKILQQQIRRAHGKKRRRF